MVLIIYEKYGIFWDISMEKSPLSELGPIDRTAIFKHSDGAIVNVFEHILPYAAYSKSLSNFSGSFSRCSIANEL